MTNTSENRPEPAKTPKSKGPFRTGMLVPTLLLMAIVYGWFYLFFDVALRKGMQLAAGRLYGAEVDIGSVHTSFLHARFRMTDLQVTDKEHPERNLVQVGEIKFGALWDALLRGKIAIDEAAILDVQAYVPRAHTGWVAPPPPPPKPGSGVLAQAEHEVLRQTQAKFNQNFLGDIASVVGGADPKAQLKEIQGSLKAQARAEELARELDAKKAEWQKRIKDLPTQKDIDDIANKIKALDLKGGNPLQMAGKLKQAKELVDQATGKVKQVDEAQSQLQADIAKYSKSGAELEKLAQEDVSDLQKRLKLPSIDPKEFSTQLFLSLLEKKLTGIRKYIEIARKYMPKKPTAAEKAAAAEKAKREKEEELVPPARGQGRTYHFPITKGYPLFWLKKAQISSQISDSEWAGNVKGEITDVTTSPSALGRPTKIHFAGEFPRQKIAGLNVLATLDHTGEEAHETIEGRVAAFPVENQMFADSGGVKLGLKQAVGTAALTANLVDMSLDVGLQSKFDHPDFTFEAQNAMVKDILGSVLKGMPAVTMNAHVAGSWEHFNMNIDSNLGSELSNGFQKQLQAKLGAAKAQLDSLVNDKIGPAKKKVQELLGGLTGGPAKALGGQKDEMNKALQKAQASATGGGGSPADKGKGLLKGFGF